MVPPRQQALLFDSISKRNKIQDVIQMFLFQYQHVHICVQCVSLCFFRKSRDDNYPNLVSKTLGKKELFKAENGLTPWNLIAR